MRSRVLTRERESLLEELAEVIGKGQREEESCRLSQVQRELSRLHVSTSQLLSSHCLIVI